MTMLLPDRRPKTVVLHQFSGIGDLIWHIPYFERVAASSYGGQVAVIASPTTFARQLLSAETWVSEIIDHDNRPRRHEQRVPRHRGLRGIWRLAGELKPHGFERIVIFSDHANRGLLAWLAGIPQRLGYGWGWMQRLFLTQPPYIAPYRGPSVPVYKNITEFSLAHGFCDRPLLPRVKVPPVMQSAMVERLAGLPRPIVAFGIGCSEPEKQWGADNFGALAQRLLARGGSVILLGGPAEAELGQQIHASLRGLGQDRVRVFCGESVIGTAGLLRLVQACVSNDTGVANLAPASEIPTFALLGPRPLLDHDPLIHPIRAASLSEVTVAAVEESLIAVGIIGRLEVS